jgi:ACS family D-galactonate transporter-like MFS transporter
MAQGSASALHQESLTAPKPPPGASKVRYKILFLAFLGIAMNYLDRANISVALPYMDEELGLNLSNTEKGLILSAFFWAYDGAMLFAGWLTDRLGARKAFALAAIWWSVFTAATPLARSFGGLFAVRFLLGAGEAPAYPSSTKAASQWFPKHERAFATAVIDSGSRVGTLLALPVITALIAWVSWHFSFILLGGLGIVWALLWYLYYRDPDLHKGANDEERNYIATYGARSSATDEVGGPTVRWVDLFRYRTIKGMMLGFFCLNFVIYFFLTWFPSYLKDARGMDLKQMGLVGTIPAATAIVAAWVAGSIADRLVTRGANVTRVRKTFCVGGLLGGSTIFLAAMAPQVSVMILFFAIAYASLSIAGTGIWCLPADVAPSSRQVASIGGIQNFASNFAGILSPILFGVVLDLNNGSYTYAFLIAAIVAVAGAFTYAFVVGKAEPLPPLEPRKNAHAE